MRDQHLFTAHTFSNFGLETVCVDLFVKMIRICVVLKKTSGRQDI